MRIETSVFRVCGSFVCVGLVVRAEEFEPWNSRVRNRLGLCSKEVGLSNPIQELRINILLPCDPYLVPIPVLADFSDSTNSSMLQFMIQQEAKAQVIVMNGDPSEVVFPKEMYVGLNCVNSDWSESFHLLHKKIECFPQCARPALEMVLDAKRSA